jgi:DNA-directed RNA polymerase specialized sigma24 family protein
LDGGPKTEEFLRLLGAHERNLFAYVYALAPNWQDAEEVMQRLRIRIWQQFDQYETDKPFDAWARAIAYYLVLAFRKEKSRQREFFAERILEAVSREFENTRSGRASGATCWSVASTSSRGGRRTWCRSITRRRGNRRRAWPSDWR